ncbi:alpha/beta hydrolase [Paludibacterium paludis]|uniref:Alpha/beta hydrolase n=1 Tax=Paludibacterium paludis TaxID=1225769 RepID=A0A918NWL9_9NEIS|nr:alpha/beta hydrolase [Paludibacterium paludis]GGY03083.1 alpha/beta hydrolase [Paludibacterium paludis]
MKLMFTGLTTIGTLLLGTGAALWLGGPSTPAVMTGFTRAFRQVDYSGVPPLSRYTARDGARLAYRLYAPQDTPRGSVVLVHGSSATSRSMHVIAQALAAAGYSAYALDIRGHGDSGVKGHLDHIGQLEEDLEDFASQANPVQPATLAGFSSGGGFVLRIAAEAQARLFQSFLLLSPYLRYDAPTQRANSGGWSSVGIPRLVALGLLNRAGFTKLNDLPVIRFGIDPANRDLLTESYDFNLAANFGPPRDYEAAIRAANRPVMVLAGERDEAFHTERFPQVFAACPGLAGVRLIPGTTHPGLILDAAPVREAVLAVQALQAKAARP